MDIEGEFCNERDEWHLCEVVWVGNLNLAEVGTYAQSGMKAKTLVSSSSCNIPMKGWRSESVLSIKYIKDFIVKHMELNVIGDWSGEYHKLSGWVVGILKKE